MKKIKSFFIVYLWPLLSTLIVLSSGFLIGTTLETGKEKLNSFKMYNEPFMVFEKGYNKEEINSLRLCEWDRLKIASFFLYKSKGLNKEEIIKKYIDNEERERNQREKWILKLNDIFTREWNNKDVITYLAEFRNNCTGAIERKFQLRQSPEVFI